MVDENDNRWGSDDDGPIDDLDDNPFLILVDEDESDSLMGGDDDDDDRRGGSLSFSFTPSILGVLV